MPMPGRKGTKRACDGCKIRKVRCSEVAPCKGCVSAGIACTFVKIPVTRGPRTLRERTLKEIRETQRACESAASEQSVREAESTPDAAVQTASREQQKGAPDVELV